MEVAFLCPMSGLSTVLASVGSDLGLPCRVYVHRDGIAQGRVGVGKACGRSSLSQSGGHRNVAYAGSRKVGLLVEGVEGFVHGAVLVHPNSKAEPDFGIHV